MQTVKYDVVIVGAGPAGSLLAYALSRKDIRVLLVEKKKLPREKTCGGGLTSRTLKILPFDVGPVLEDSAHSAELRLNHRTIFSRTYKEPIAGLVTRQIFDHFLVRQAQGSGAVLRDGTEFTGVSGCEGNLSVSTSTGLYRSRLLAGADGIYGKTAGALGLSLRTKRMTAVEAEIELRPPSRMEPFRHSLQFDFGIIPGGYGWVFPKKDHLSAGILSISRGRGIKNSMDAYLRSRGLDRGSKILSARGHGIPYGLHRRDRYANRFGLLLGDAAGMVDPVTGEGIYYAVRTARLASEIIEGALKSATLSIEAYDEALKKELYPEIACARMFAFLLFRLPAVSHCILRAHATRIAENHIKIITGEKTYRKLYGEVFSRAGIRTLLHP